MQDSDIYRLDSLPRHIPKKNSGIIVAIESSPPVDVPKKVSRVKGPYAHNGSDDDTDEEYDLDCRDLYDEKIFELKRVEALESNARLKLFLEKKRAFQDQNKGSENLAKKALSLFGF